VIRSERRGGGLRRDNIPFEKTLSRYPPGGADCRASNFSPFPFPRMTLIDVHKSLVLPTRFDPVGPIGSAAPSPIFCLLYKTKGSTVESEFLVKEPIPPPLTPHSPFFFRRGFLYSPPLNEAVLLLEVLGGVWGIMCKKRPVSWAFPPPDRSTTASFLLLPVAYDTARIARVNSGPFSF